MTHLSACPPSAPPLLTMPASSYDSSTAASSPAFFPHLIAEFQRSLHTRLLSVVHCVSTSATDTSPLAVHQWLQEQLVACLDAEKRYILHSPPPPSLPLPSSSASTHPVAVPALTALTAPQLSDALSDLTLSAAEAINANKHRQQQQQQVERVTRRDEEHKSRDESESERADDAEYRATAARSTRRRSSIGRAHLHSHPHAHPHPHSHSHHHHHGHAVEVSVRCLPTTASVVPATYARPHSHDDDDESTASGQITASSYTHTASAYKLSTAVTAKREREDTTRAPSPPCCSPVNHSSFLSPLPCLPNCNLPSLSPCLSSSPCLDFNCLDPTPFSLCDDDPLCCFPSFGSTDDVSGSGSAQHSHHTAMLGGGGDGQYENEDALCSSPLSSVCLPMPCDPCSVSSASTTTTTTTVLSCVPCADDDCGDDDECNARSHVHSPLKADEDEGGDKQLSPPSNSNNNDTNNSSVEMKPPNVTSASSPRSASTAASTSVMVSCHQCKLKKPSTQCMQCTCNGQKAAGGGKKRCVKKYCSTCLSKHYQYAMTVKEEGAEQADWICPACKGACSCAACARRKLMDEEEASMVSAFHHHHTHAHVTIHSLPHHHHTHPHPPISHPMPPPAMPAMRASCHQCKSSKSSLHLLACSSRRSLTADGKRLRDCKKKYCAVCLERWYGLDMEEIKRKEREGGTGWRCPACEGICPCAACRRKGERKREDGGKEDEEETVDGSDEDEESDRRAKRGRFVHHHHLHSHTHLPHHHHHAHQHPHPHGHAHAHTHHPHHVHHTMHVLPAAGVVAPSTALSESTAASPAPAADSASTTVSEAASKSEGSAVSQWDNEWSANGESASSKGVGKPWVDSNSSSPRALRNRA